jgi:hypothetical protein
MVVVAKSRSVLGLSKAVRLRKIFEKVLFFEAFEVTR